MPTVEGTQVKCPECGATVRASEAATVAKCEYCGTESRVQRRTQIFQLPIRMPTPAADHPQRVAVQVRTRTWPVAMLVILPILLPIGIPLMIWAGHKRGWTDHMTWNGNPALVVDVDGDGISDAVGLVRYAQRDLMTILAVSGKDGHTLWETPSLGKYMDVYQATIAVAGTTLLRADTDKRAHVEAFDAKTGAKKWEITPSEVADKLCVGSSPADVLLVTKDKRGWKLELDKGTLTPAVATEDCAELQNDHKNHHMHGWDERYRDLKIDGMSIEHVLHDGKPPFIAVGAKSPGTRIPMIAAIDETDKVLWKTELPGHDALTAKHTDAEWVAVTNSEVATVYERDNDAAPELVVFDLANGARRFEVATQKSDVFSVWMHGFAVSPTAAFITVGSGLQAFDLKTGKPLFRSGQL